MTVEIMNLRTFLEKTPDADFLREMIGFAAQRIMELEVGATTRAGYGEKTAEHLAQLNGYRDRIWETRAGTVDPTNAFTRCLYRPSGCSCQTEKGRAMRGSSHLPVSSQNLGKGK